MLQPTTAKYQKVNIPAFIGGVFPIYVCAFLLGIIIYFALPFEPRLGHILLLSIALFVLAGGLYYFEHHKTRIISGYAWGYWGFNFIFILGITAVGILYSAHYTQQQNTPFWPQAFAQKTVWLNGQLEAIKHRQNKYAVLTITNVTTYHKDRVRTWPKMVITVHEKRLNNEKVGAHIAAQVQLRPPTTSLRPSTYDWQRRSYFEGTSAVGFVMGQFYITPQQAETVHAKLRTIREGIAHKLKSQHQEHSALGVGVALLTGLRGLITPELREAYAQSGLAHIMAISGMHLGMLAGFIYLVLRAVFVRCGTFALHYDIRKPAAFLAFLGAVGYALLAGATIPTLRALALIAGAFIAILLGRVHLSVRMLAFIALGLALYNPFWVIGASFQLSFVASLALLFWAYLRKRESLFLGELAPSHHKGADVLKASVIATLATTPLVALHFGSVPILGVFSNMVALPFFAMCVLPLGFLWLLLPITHPFITALYLWAVQVLNSIALFFAQIPWGVVNPGEYAFFLFLLWVLLAALLLRKRRIVLTVILVLALVIGWVYVKPGPVLVASIHKDGVAVFNGTSYQNLGGGKTQPWLQNIKPNFKLGMRVLCNTQGCSFLKEGGHTALFTVKQPWASFSEEDCKNSLWLLDLGHTLPKNCGAKRVTQLLTHPSGTVAGGGTSHIGTTHIGMHNFDVFLKKNGHLFIREYAQPHRWWHKNNG